MSATGYDNRHFGDDGEVRTVSGQLTWDVEWWEAAGGKIEQVPSGVSGQSGKSPPCTFTPRGSTRDG